jgi:hypothetical protein
MKILGFGMVLAMDNVLFGSLGSMLSSMFCKIDLQLELDIGKCGE